MKTIDKEPQMNDEVVHASGLEIGTVIAKYPIDQEPKEEYKSGWALDVRIGDRRIRYGTSMENWRVINPDEEGAIS